MRLATICVAQPAIVRDGKEMVRTGIFKQPAAGPVRVGRFNLDGDGQADLENHGGEHKAVYAYSADHYPWWRETLGREDLAHGHFGENLTIEGLDESAAFLGDHWRIGTARFALTQPRVPCFKLGLRFGDAKMPKAFARSLRTGCYLKVVEEGMIEPGDEVTLMQRGRHAIRIDRLFEALILTKSGDPAGILAHALEVEELSPEWRAPIRERLDMTPHSGRRP
jgi:MOSC domain-containing protein YiiM